MIKLSFTLRILAINFIVLALPLLIDSFIFFQNSYEDSIGDAKNRLRQIANFRAFTLSEIHPVKQVLLKEVNYLFGLAEILQQKEISSLEAKLQDLAQAMKGVQLFVLKKDSESSYRLIASSLADPQTIYYRQSVLEDIEVEKEASIIRYIYSPIDKTYKPYIFVARTIQTEKQEIVGILMAGSEIREELNILTQPEKSEVAPINFAILNRDGIVFDSNVANLKGEYFDAISPVRKKEIIDSDILGDIDLEKDRVTMIPDGDPPFFEFVFEGSVQIAYRAFAPDKEVSVIAFTSKEEFFAKAISRFLFIYSIYGLILVVGGGITYWLSTLVSRPLRQLSSLMGEVSAGNLNVRFKEQPLGFEINKLGMIFNLTLEKILGIMQQKETERVKRETYERELAIGHEAQKNLLPLEVPHLKNLEVAGAYSSVKEAGGDFYSFFVRKTTEGKEALFFGVTDAAGKGISSCLYAVSFRSLAMTYSYIYDNVGEALSKSNNAFLEDAGDTGMFVKALSGVFFPDEKELQYYSCGNVPGIVRKANGHLLSLEHSGMAIGLKESTLYKPDKILLSSGDIVVFFTDGLTEAVNEKNQFFSQRRLKNLLQERNWKSAQEVVDGITESVKIFSKNADLDHEITIVALKVY